MDPHMTFGSSVSLDDIMALAPAWSSGINMADQTLGIFRTLHSNRIHGHQSRLWPLQDQDMAHGSGVAWMPPWSQVAALASLISVAPAVAWFSDTDLVSGD